MFNQKTVMQLSKRKCVPCEGGVPKLNKSQIAEFNKMLKEPWEVIDDMKIQREYNFRDFNETMKFVNKAAEIAELEAHHPVMHVFYSKIVFEIWTHAILGLSENDFILAAKYNEIEI
jgi:4a-hydroxytetrahydrobiopterin dehydratase